MVCTLCEQIWSPIHVICCTQILYIFPPVNTYCTCRQIKPWQSLVRPFVFDLIIIKTLNQMKVNLIRYLRSLKNYSISSMNDFNRVSHISGGLLFRLYHCSTFVTCQIIFPPHVMFICQNSVVQSCLLLHVQLNQILV